MSDKSQFHQMEQSCAQILLVSTFRVVPPSFPARKTIVHGVS